MKECAVNRERAVIANHQMPEVAEPREGALDFPAPAVAPQRSSVLGHRFASIPAMRGDQFDPALSQPLSQRVTVVTTIRRSGFCRGRPAWVRRPTQIVASVVSASCVSCGDAEQRCFPKGRPWPSTTTIHTSCPCPAWFFRLQRPFFGGSKTPVQERRAPLQLLPFVEFG